MANDPVRSIAPKANISLHPLTYRGLSFEAEMLSILRACISPACLWSPKSLEAKSAWLEHTPLALWIVDALWPWSPVELGTHDGYSYFVFCRAVKHLELYTPIRSTFDDASPHFADQTIDLPHIDGCYDYEQDICHFAAWRPRLSDRGVVLFHDTNEQAAEPTAIRRRAVQAEAACAA